MPKKAISAQERMNREFLAALRGGQARLGEKDIHTSQLMPDCGQRAYYNRVKTPEKFTLQDIRVIAQRYQFTDYQLCQIIGIPYNGSSPV